MSQPFLIPVRGFPDTNGDLWALEGGDLPWPVARTFWVRAPKGVMRGSHAHHRCHQLLICLVGRVEVAWWGATEEGREVLVDPGQGLMVPPMVWCEQHYLDDRNVLLALCDRRYEADDYIRDRAAWRRLVGRDGA